MATRKPLAAGRLRDRVVILAKTVSRGADYGQEVPSWSEEATVWAEVEQVEASEKATPTERVMTRRYAVTLRTRAGLTTDKRLRLADATVLEIMGVVKTLRGDAMVVSCVEYSSGA